MILVIIVLAIILVVGVYLITKKQKYKVLGIALIIASVIITSLISFKIYENKRLAEEASEQIQYQIKNNQDSI